MAAFVALMVSAHLSTSAADAPLWMFDGAKWYAMMESGNVMVGTKTGVAMLDGANGKQVWARNDLGEIKEDEYTELSGTPLILFADNSGWAQRKTKLTPLTH
jgi:ribosomal protein L30E